jgi:hypothetical protein
MTEKTAGMYVLGYYFSDKKQYVGLPELCTFHVGSITTGGFE